MLLFFFIVVYFCGLFMHLLKDFNTKRGNGGSKKVVKKEHGCPLAQPKHFGNQKL